MPAFKSLLPAQKFTNKHFYEELNVLVELTALTMQELLTKYCSH
jgi:hypothetical protein